MGLDMYLEGRRYLSPTDEGTAPARKAVAAAIGFEPPASKPGGEPELMEVVAVSVRVGYWRKSYPLHQWFVDNVQEGHDDCRPAYVSDSVLRELQARLEQVRSAPESVSEHFVVEEGEALDEDEIDFALDVLSHARRLQEAGWDLYYRSSW